LPTTKELSKKYYWPNLKGDVEKYVASCIKCQMNKATIQKTMGLLRPLPIRQSQGNPPKVSMDFMISLPLVQEFDTIFVVIDRFSKEARFMPIK